MPYMASLYQRESVDSSSSSAPPLTLSSSSSTTSSVVAQQLGCSDNNVAGNINAAQSTSANANNNNSSTIPKNKVGRPRKIDKSMLCPKCQGDVRLPPQSDTNLGGEKGLDALAIVACDIDEQRQANKALDLVHVTCASKSCSAPRYHVSRSIFPLLLDVFIFLMLNSFKCFPSFPAHLFWNTKRQPNLSNCNSSSWQ